MVGAEHPAAPLHRVLAQGAGRLHLAQLGQGKGESAGSGEGLGIVQAEEGPPAVEQLLADGPAAVAVAAGLQVAGGVQRELPAGG